MTTESQPYTTISPLSQPNHPQPQQYQDNLPSLCSESQALIFNSWTAIYQFLASQLQSQRDSYNILHRNILANLIKDTLDRLKDCHSNCSKLQIIDTFIQKKTQVEKKIVCQDLKLLKIDTRKSAIYYKEYLKMAQHYLGGLHNQQRQLFKHLLSVTPLQQHRSQILKNPYLNSLDSQVQGQLDDVDVESEGEMHLLTQNILVLKKLEVKSLRLIGSVINVCAGSNIVLDELKELRLSTSIDSLSSILKSPQLFNLPNLKSLELDLIINAQDQVRNVTILLSHASKLSRLSIRDHYGHLSRLILPQLFKKQVRHFKINFSYSAISTFSTALFQQLKELTALRQLFLDLSHTKLLLFTDRHILVEIFKHLTNLKALHLNLNDSKADARFIFGLLHAIKFLNIFELFLDLTRSSTDENCLHDVIYVVSQMSLIKFDLKLGELEKGKEELSDYWEEKFSGLKQYSLTII